MPNNDYVAVFVQEIPEKFEIVRIRGTLLSIFKHDFKKEIQEGHCLSIRNENSEIFLRCEIDESVMDNHVALSYENAAKLGKILGTVEIRPAEKERCIEEGTPPTAYKGSRPITLEKGFEWDNITDTTFGDIKGLDDIKEQFKSNIVYNLLHPERYLLYEITPPRSFLFFGPPGCGKTMFAKAIANDLIGKSQIEGGRSINIKFKAIKSSDIKSKYIGESAKTIDDYFKLARAESERGSSVILFFDEIDSIVPSRSYNDLHEEYRDVVNIFLQELEGVKDVEANIKLKELFYDEEVVKIRKEIFDEVKKVNDKKDKLTVEYTPEIEDKIAKLRSKIDDIGGISVVIIIGATNNPYRLDDAFISRLRDNALFIPRPDIKAIEEILLTHLEKPYIDINKNQIEELAEEAYKRNLTGRDIDGWMKKVRDSIPNKCIAIIGYDTIKSCMPDTSIGIEWERRLYDYLKSRGYTKMAEQVKEYIEKFP